MNKAVVHACPIDDSIFTPCCHLPPFELPHHDRITVMPADVTCWTGTDPRLTGGQG